MTKRQILKRIPDLTPTGVLVIGMVLYSFIPLIQSIIK